MFKVKKTLFFEYLKKWTIDNNIFNENLINWIYLKNETDKILREYEYFLNFNYKILKNENKEEEIDEELWKPIEKIIFLWFKFWFNRNYENCKNIDLVINEFLINCFKYY